MGYKANPFLERMSERMTSDSEFVRLFSPKILERLDDDAFSGAVHVFRSAPGGGKTTLLRAFTPPALQAFWSARKTPDLSESYQKLVGKGVLDAEQGPKLLGVLLTCAAGYADLPPGADIEQDSLFRALLDCRVVLRTIRSAAALAGLGANDDLSRISLTYDSQVSDLRGVPLFLDAAEMAGWAERVERNVYAALDSLAFSAEKMPAHYRFESVLWLQSVRFHCDGIELAPRRLLMIDDVQRLKKRQRDLLIDELTVLRPSIPVWLSERSIAVGEEELLSQGSREGRDIKFYSLEDIWSSQKGGFQAFQGFAQSVLERRMKRQDALPSSSFSQFLRSEMTVGELRAIAARAWEDYSSRVQRFRQSPRYAAWIEAADKQSNSSSIDSIVELYSTLILLSRDENKRQMSLSLSLTAEEFEDRDSSQVRGAAELFANHRAGLPYYFGFDRLCAMSSSNVDELLFLASELYVGLQARQMLRRADLLLSPAEQEKVLRAAAKKKRDFIPRNHSEGQLAQRLLDAIGAFCFERSTPENAPYAPGVTGIRLSTAELASLAAKSKIAGSQKVLRDVLAECVAENLLTAREIQASTNRDSGTVFYLNRTLCANYGLPLQFGGWQEVKVATLVQWMESGPPHVRRLRIGGLH